MGAGGLVHTGLSLERADEPPEDAQLGHGELAELLGQLVVLLEDDRVQEAHPGRVAARGAGARRGARAYRTDQPEARFEQAEMKQALQQNYVDTEYRAIERDRVCASPGSARVAGVFFPPSEIDYDNKVVLQRECVSTVVTVSARPAGRVSPP